MTTATPATTDYAERLTGVLKQYWGFDRLRPLQEDAIRAGCDRRDSLVVLPTGGGKSLCYQVPALLTGAPTIVISPLISLMKDQVDGLRACGYPAAAMHSGMSPDDRRAVETALADNKLSLLFLSPERVAMDGFARTVAQMGVRSFAVDEAHCISHWGHDFRPEYRQLSTLKDRFPGASIHAYTATATPRVRDDIVSQLRLTNPAILVGSFDRPNLVYRVVPRESEYEQVLEVIHRHPREAVIVYCISRKDTEALAGFLQSSQVRAAAYHAGLSPDVRRRIQDEFSRENLDVVVATVAFGMGIDRSNVRCVIHAAMPKSIEAYQQETGRAGRDGLEAECIMLFGAGDPRRWESLVTRSAGEGDAPKEVLEATLLLIQQMGRFARTTRCRHRYLVEHFGQSYENKPCGACDNCLGELGESMDATIIAQKILSCVARVEQRFGIQHVVDVLLGRKTEMIDRCRHEKLSTFGLLTGTPRNHVVDWVHQLADQELVTRTAGEYPILQLNDRSWKVLRSQERVRLRQPSATKTRTRSSRAEAQSWVGVDEQLFEALRALRRELASERNVAAFVILSDASLRELARVRPKTLPSLRNVSGFAQRKIDDFGERILSAIASHGGGSRSTPRSEPSDKPRRTVGAAAQIARSMYARGCGIDEVATAIERSRSTATKYLAEFIEIDRPDRIDTWVDVTTYDAVAVAAREVGMDRLRPIFLLLEENVPYDVIRLVVTHLSVAADGANAERGSTEPSSTEGSSGRELGDRPKPSKPPTEARQTASAMFARGCSVDEVATTLERAQSTALQYLVEFIETTQPEQVDAWVNVTTYNTVAEAIREVGAASPKRISDRMSGQVPYETIRVVAAHVRSRAT